MLPTATGQQFLSLLLLLATRCITGACATVASEPPAPRVQSVSVLGRQQVAGGSSSSSSSSSSGSSTTTGSSLDPSLARLLNRAPQGATHPAGIAQPLPAPDSDYSEDAPNTEQQDQQRTSAAGSRRSSGGVSRDPATTSGGEGGDGESTGIGNRSGGLGHGSGSSSGGSGGSRAGALLRGGPWRGLSLGNVPLFPLRTAAAGRLNHTEAELRAIIQEAVRDLAAAGGNLLRVWFHIDGSMSPPAWAQEAQPAQPAQQFGQRPPIAAAGGALSGDDGDGGGCTQDEADRGCACGSCGCSSRNVSSMCGSAAASSSAAVCGCGAAAVADLKWLLRLCHRSAVKVLLVLWSHDMLAVRRDNPPPSRDRALHMVTTAAGTAAYIRNCLSPLVQHLAAIAIRDQDDADGAAPAASEEGTGCGPGSCCSSNCCRGGNPAGGVSGGGGGSSGQRVEPGAFSGTAFPALRSASNSSSGGASWGPCVLSLSHGVEPAGAGPNGGGTEGGSSGVGRHRSSSLRHLLSNSAAEVAVQNGRGTSNDRTRANTTAAAVPAAADEVQEKHAGGERASGYAAGEGEAAASSKRASSIALCRRSSAPAAPAAPTSDLRTGGFFPDAEQPTSLPLSLPPVQQNQTKEGGPGSTDDSLHSRDSHGGGGGGGGGGGAPTYSSVLLGYELLNEPEGMSWELRLYHNYMYDTAWGLYQLEDPDWYGRQVARRGDYRTLQVLKACGGLSTPAQGRDDLRDYTGWHFVGGNRPLAVARGNGSRTATSAAPCISRGSLLDPAGGGAASADGGGACDLQQESQREAQQQTASTFSTLVNAVDEAAAASARPWYLNTSSTCGSSNSSSDSSSGSSSLAKAWEAAAAQVVVSPCDPAAAPDTDNPHPAPPEGVPSSPRLWFNRLMYIDVIAHHNSELPYLLPLATGCRLRTVDVSVRRLQRFVSRLAAAVHAADPAALVTVGSHSPPYCSDAQWLVGNITEFEPRPRNLFSDAELRRAFVLRNGSLGRGWDATGAGTLDFYAPHGYPYWGHASVTRLISPFHVSARQYQLDKPALIGEFWDQVSDDEALTSKHWGDLWRKGGYVGGLGWAMLQVVEDPNDAGQAGNAAGTGWTLAAPRRLVGHEKRAVFLRLLREMRAGGL